MWNGLIMDQDAAHFKKMGNALWLYFYLVINANRSTGMLVRKVKTISADTGIGRRKIFDWLGILRSGGYILTKNSGRCLAITINKWKPLGKVPPSAHQQCRIPNFRSAENLTSEMLSQARIISPIKGNSEAETTPKKNTIKENNLNRRIDIKNLNPIAFKSREELLAYDLASTLDDLSAFPLYLSLARKNSESVLRETLGKVREIPENEIKTSRGALFNFLIQRNAIRSKFNPRR